ncbi:hypothetical protein BDE02_12G060000 [Populus trichocarpa]|nr:hypothetical protein BDE02_12G060000 [Populus trichocarpa]
MWLGRLYSPREQGLLLVPTCREVGAGLLRLDIWLLWDDFYFCTFATSSYWCWNVTRTLYFCIWRGSFVILVTYFLAGLLDLMVLVLELDATFWHLYYFQD